MSPIAGPHITDGATAREPSRTSALNVMMYDAGSRGNVFTAWTPLLSSYSKRTSIGDETLGAAGAALTAYRDPFSVAVSASLAVVSVKGSGCAFVGGSTSSCGSCD